MRTQLAILVGVTVLAPASPAIAQDDDAESRGVQLYVAQCARCHGMRGGGGEGPSLLGREFTRAADDDGLVRIIRSGIGGTAMPGAGWLDPEEAQLIAEYVWTMARVEVESIPGDPAAGRALFEQKGECASCHIVDGKGTGIGPDLSDIGARRDARYLRRSLMNPGAVLPVGQLGPHSNFLVVHAYMKDGGSIRGMRVTEDSFVIVLRDKEGEYRTLKLSDIETLEREFGTSFMPDYEEDMTEEEIMNLVAYMASLRGRS